MEENSSSENGKKWRLNKKTLGIILALVLLVLVCVGVFFYIQDKNTKKPAQDQNKTSSQDTNTLLAQIGKLIELPIDETPTIATVSDVTKLSDQPFFKNAKNDDKVLIYSKAQKAILYRPSTNKIIEVAPVNIGNNNKTGTSPTPSVAISPSITTTDTPTKTLTPSPTPFRTIPIQ